MSRLHEAGMIRRSASLATSVQTLREFGQPYVNGPTPFERGRECLGILVSESPFQGPIIALRRQGCSPHPVPGLAYLFGK